jgi:hypothetical protein
VIFCTGHCLAHFSVFNGGQVTTGRREGDNRREGVREQEYTGHRTSGWREQQLN